MISGGGSKCTVVCGDCHKELRFIYGKWVTLSGNEMCRPTKAHKPVAGEAR
jgi:hypothetical protein